MCGLEFPDLETNIWRRFKARGVEVVGIDPGGLTRNEGPATVAQFVRQTGVTFPVGFELTSTYGAFSTDSGISPFPLDVVIGPDGRVAYVRTEYDAAAIAAAVEKLLGR